ncbi:Hypothetical predicted protein [Mytilus galloprovincialis]|uniref:CXXC-rich protein n=1 Tax=Mytilus galloprovincialis TaxID=29158 RepID=A0A8B6CHU1_MYTGA|nr:Hypothetical predicted protein [Mytilus galloprovincialis]
MTLVSVLTIFLTIGRLSSGFLIDYACPSGCLDAKCTSSGCSNCRSGFCNYYSASNRITICTRDCGKGKFCSSVNYCSDCHVDQCDVCTDSRTCKQCDSYYYLRDNNRCVTSFDCERGSAIATTRNGIQVCETCHVQDCKRCIQTNSNRCEECEYLRYLDSSGSIDQCRTRSSCELFHGDPQYSGGKYVCLKN